jgi:D-glycerate 3-kinase
MISNEQIQNFIAVHYLPAEFVSLIEKHYLPLAAWIVQMRRPGETLLIGINGAQGTGKSTLAEFLQLALRATTNWNVAVLSIDDFYLTRMQREHLASEVHPLLRTRGVPGTHDASMLSKCLDALLELDADSVVRLPRFDKSKDDRAEKSEWTRVSGPVDLIILEGWCVGSTAQPIGELAEPINELEETEDDAGKWRAFVNDQLTGVYAQLFARLDALIFLQVPGFEVVHRWRLLQEEKLAASKPEETSGIMNARQLVRFIQHYERITRTSLAVLPDLADVVLELDESHNCVGRYFK